MGEQLPPAGNKHWRVEDIDTAEHMAKAEKPFREKMLMLAKMGVPQAKIEEKFEDKIDNEAIRAMKVYPIATERADYLLLEAVDNPGFERYVLDRTDKILLSWDDDMVDAVEFKVVDILKERIAGERDFKLSKNKEGRYIFCYQSIV